MPEGDTVYQTAKRQNEALAGQELTGFQLRVPKFATADLTGETVREVAAAGKHLFHRIGDWSLHSHLKMDGSWRLVRPGGRWPNRRSRRGRCCTRHPSPRSVSSWVSPS